MAPRRKKTPSMIWVVKSKPSTDTKMALLDCSSLSDSLPPSSSTKIPQQPGWSLLPQELLLLISEKLEDSFDASIHARSVCHPWRSTFPYPSKLLSRITYSLPSFDKFPRNRRGFCTLQNFPVYLFISRASASSHSEFFLGGIVRDHHFERASPIQCSVKVKIPWSDPASINVSDYQIVPLGREYEMVGYDPNSLATSFIGVAFLPVTKNGEREFVVLLGYSNALLVLTSSEKKWKRLEHTAGASCKDIVTFKGRFYVVFLNGDVFVIDPYSLEAIQIPPLPELQNCGKSNYLVPSRTTDELFLVQVIIPRTGVLRLGRFACRVSKLDEESGEWVLVTDLGDLVLLIGPPGNTSCLGKDLPEGCGVSGNSMLFTDDLGGVTHPYKYGVPDTGSEDEDLNFWRPTREKNRVTILSSSPNPMVMKSPVVALQIER